MTLRLFACLLFCLRQNIPHCGYAGVVALRRTLSRSLSLCSFDAKPIHCFYERPHLWALLPKNLAGLQVLDIGCGNGWYAEQLHQAGALVTAIDASKKMIEITRQRLQGQGNYFVADLNQPLDMFADSYFDLIVAPLVIHYIQDWQYLFQQLSRKLKSQGKFVFSVHHPFLDMQLFHLEDYFATTLLKDFWPVLEVKVNYYHHSLHELCAALGNAGFILEKMVEPKPLPACAEADPAFFAKASRLPWLLFVCATKNR